MKFHFQFLSLFAIISLLTACAPTQSTDTDIQKEPLRIEYTLWWGDYTLLIADELGIFEKYGVDVEPVYYESYADSYSDIASNILDGGLLALDDAINTNDKNPIKAVAIYDDGGFYYVVGSSEIKNISDLRGKRIGTNIGMFGELLVLQALKEANLTIKDVTLVEMPVEEVPKQLGDTIDAGYTWDPYASEAVTNGGSILFESGGARTIMPDVIVFNTNTLEKRPEDVRAFLQAWFEAVEYRKQNEEKANQLIATVTGLTEEEIVADTQIYTLQENIVLLSDQAPENMISLNTAFQINSEFLLHLGVLRDEPTINQFIDSSFLFQ